MDKETIDHFIAYLAAGGRNERFESEHWAKRLGLRAMQAELDKWFEWARGEKHLHSLR